MNGLMKRDQKSEFYKPINEQMDDFDLYQISEMALNEQIFEQITLDIFLLEPKYCQSGIQIHICFHEFQSAIFFLQAISEGNWSKQIRWI